MITDAVAVVSPQHCMPPGAGRHDDAIVLPGFNNKWQAQGFAARTPAARQCFSGKLSLFAEADRGPESVG